ncbi:MAG: GNAT family protein [Pseudomonadota bacterium]
MAFLRAPTFAANDTDPLTGPLVFARHPAPEDYAEWARVRDVSRASLTPWEPTWAEDELSRAAYRRRLRRYARDIREGDAHPYFFFRGADGVLLGGCTFSHVRRGAAAACSLGYWIGAPYRRRGYTLAALQLLLPHVMQELNLNRVEAACLPNNVASRNLLLKAGFREEGRARNYLRINGAWRDHLLFGLIRSDLPELSA